MLREKLQAALKDAMRSKDDCALGTVRLILAALKDRDIAARSKGASDGVDEDEILQMLQSMVKQRRESIKMYEEAGRCDLAEREQREIGVIETFMPAQMGDDEVRAAVESLIAELEASSPKDMGRVMTELRGRYLGRMDFGTASSVVKDALV